eukprot:884284-Pleurochrysis_carterae.AAC.1
MGVRPIRQSAPAQLAMPVRTAIGRSPAPLSSGDARSASTPTLAAVSPKRESGVCSLSLIHI